MMNTTRTISGTPADETRLNQARNVSLYVGIGLASFLFITALLSRVIRTIQSKRLDSSSKHSRRMLTSNEPDLELTPVKAADISEVSAESNEMDIVMSFGKNLNPDIRAKIDYHRITPDRLHLGKRLGQGHFGSVYKGQLTTPEGNLKTVAVKSLRDDIDMSFDSLESFLAEGTLMIDFNHRNVLHLIGVQYEEGDRPLIVLPFMENGDLHTFIKQENQDLDLGDVVHFSYQIANGMDYLANERFVHRDLAARNCMIDGSFIVKIADFGLSRDVYERDYYVIDNMSTPLPMKWMAVESLREGRYTSKSDVWSLGVTMWELLTRGSSPYPGVPNHLIKQYVMSGNRLDKPEVCPPCVYEMMSDCWDEEPVKRPKFIEISNFLYELLKRNSESERAAADDQFYGYSYVRNATRNIPENYIELIGEDEYSYCYW